MQQVEKGLSVRCVWQKGVPEARFFARRNGVRPRGGVHKGPALSKKRSGAMLIRTEH